ncbi:hypothetical protein EST38_g6030 [Candolleomyces aberdarensis]|uniref:F-box domain-containing protein n=1 Tax=Candolleomyces aberdarensis TaxID=2316362 RepID=A0A4Q2DKR9_9AGAR|nr:hypothetical protein EST38_g6030 [Candolleomyces aberdarensis]
MPSSHETAVFPTDIWLYMIDYLAPPDVIALSQVSRELHGTLSVRSVWVTIFRSMCDDHGLFQPSYQVDNMSLAELQHAALGPDRWYKRVEKHHFNYDSDGNPGKLDPFSTTALPLLSDPGIPCRFCLVPGGRYLLSVKNNLDLWDLGPANRPPHAPGPLNVASVLVTHEMGLWNLAVSAIEPDKLRVAALFTEGPLVKVRVKVFDIRPTDPTPSFLEVGTIAIRTMYPFYRLQPLIGTGNRIYVRLNKGSGVIWDLKTKQYVLAPISGVEADGAQVSSVSGSNGYH